jgi:acetoacetyl-CoA synthetase
MPYTQVVESETVMFPPPKWFIGARLNYAENLLHSKFDDDKLAILFQRKFNSNTL